IHKIESKKIIKPWTVYKRQVVGWEVRQLCVNHLVEMKSKEGQGPAIAANASYVPEYKIGRKRKIGPAKEKTSKKSTNAEEKEKIEKEQDTDEGMDESEDETEIIETEDEAVETSTSTSHLVNVNGKRVKKGVLPHMEECASDQPKLWDNLEVTILHVSQAKSERYAVSGLPNRETVRRVSANKVDIVMEEREGPITEDNTDHGSDPMIDALKEENKLFDEWKKLRNELTKKTTFLVNDEVEINQVREKLKELHRLGIKKTRFQ
ncbi:unnamed protein product, partial [Darwinula stevensoni]